MLEVLISETKWAEIDLEGMAEMFGGKIGQQVPMLSLVRSI